MKNHNRGFIPLLSAIAIGIITVMSITVVALRHNKQPKDAVTVQEVKAAPSVIASTTVSQISTSSSSGPKQEAKSTPVATPGAKFEPPALPSKNVEGCPTGAVYDGFTGKPCGSAPPEQVTPPSTEQIAAFQKMCSEVPDACPAGVYTGYYTNANFRYLMDQLISNYNAKRNAQIQQQAITAKRQQIECVMAPTPEDEILLTPAQQDILRKSRCGTATSADQTNYELSQINTSLQNLEYQLQTHQSFSSSLLDSLATQPTATQKWQIRWEGAGIGTFIDSSGSSWRFHCESSGCQSY